MFPELRLRRRPRYGPFSLDETDSPPPLLNPPLPPARPIRPLPTTESIAREPVALPPASAVNVGAPPLTTADHQGRPRVMSDIPRDDRLDAERQLMTNLRNYEPRKRSRLRLIGMSALRGLAAGPGGALSGALWGTAASLIDPTIEDKRWQAEQIAQSQQRQQELMGEQRYGLQDELLRSQVEENRAQAEQRRNPRPRLIESVLPDGTQVLVPEQQGVVTGRPRPVAPRIGVDVPGVGQIETTPEAALGYYGQVGARADAQKERESVYRREETGRQSQRQAFIDEAKTLRGQAEAADANAKDLDQHIRNLEAGMATMPEGSVSAVEKDAQGNSITRTYPSGRAPFQKQIDDLKQQQQQLRQKAIDWRTQAASSEAKGKAIPEGVVSSAPPPPSGVTEASVRAEARRRGQDENTAVQRARGFGWIR